MDEWNARILLDFDARIFCWLVSFLVNIEYERLRESGLRLISFVFRDDMRLGALIEIMIVKSFSSRNVMINKLVLRVQ